MENFDVVTMDMIRWLRVSEELAKSGFFVDMITNETTDRINVMAKNLRRLPISKFFYKNYDVIKTNYNEGFNTLEKLGGSNHPFIIARLQPTGLKKPYFRISHLRQWLEYQKDKKIIKKAKFISVLTEENIRLLKNEYNRTKNVLLVPTGVEKFNHKPGKNPYKNISQKIALFAGNIYNQDLRKQNLYWQNRLNQIGKMLKNKNICLCFVGSGMTDHLNSEYVKYIGAVQNDIFFDYQYYADVGITLALDRIQKDESSKIYYYLRAGLPVISESPVPNNWLIKKSKMGFIVPFDDDVKMVNAIKKAINKKWDKKYAIKYMINNHTWDKRVEIYDEIFKKHFGLK